jgi:hypothetical protein
MTKQAPIRTRSWLFTPALKLIELAHPEFRDELKSLSNFTSSE